MLYSFEYIIKMDIGKAAILALLGLLIVFAVLAVLVGILTLFKIIFNKLDKKPKNEQVVAVNKVATANEENYDEIVAVITAAIACMSEEEAKAPFVVKNITKLK